MNLGDLEVSYLALVNSALVNSEQCCLDFSDYKFLYELFLNLKHKVDMHDNVEKLRSLFAEPIQQLLQYTKPIDFAPFCRYFLQNKTLFSARFHCSEKDLDSILSKLLVTECFSLAYLAEELSSLNLSKNLLSDFLKLVSLHIPANQEDRIIQSLIDEYGVLDELIE